MAFIIALALSLLMSPVETVALHYAGCRIITHPIGPDTVAVRWVCPTR